MNINKKQIIYGVIIIVVIAIAGVTIFSVGRYSGLWMFTPDSEGGGISYTPEPEPVEEPVVVTPSPSPIYIPPPPPTPPPNQAPTCVILSVTPTTITVGSSVTFIGRGGDSDGYIKEYRWTSSIQGIIGNLKQFSKSDLVEGTHNIVFKVKDDDGAWSAVHKVNVIVLAPNVKPVASIVTPKSNSIYYQGVSSDAQFVGTGSDSDGTISKYQWVINDNVINEAKVSISLDEFAIGTHISKFRVRDNRGDWSPYQTVTFEIKAKQDVTEDIVSSEPDEAWGDIPPPPVGTYENDPFADSDNDGVPNYQDPDWYDDYEEPPEISDDNVIYAPPTGVQEEDASQTDESYSTTITIGISIISIGIGVVVVVYIVVRRKK